MHFSFRKKVIGIVLFNALICCVLFAFNDKLFYSENKCAEHVISVRAMGNLCNQIMEYMSLYVVWKENEHELTRHKYGPFIGDDMRETLEDVFVRVSIPTFAACNKSRRSNVNERHLSNEGNAIISGISGIRWYQLQDYSARYEAILEYGFQNIRRELRFRDEIVRNVMAKLHLISKKYCRSSDCTFVGMHYRGEDYVYHLTKAYGQTWKGPPDHRYYVKSMDYFKKKFTNVIFLLVTSDIFWLRKNADRISKHGIVKVNPTNLIRNEDIVLLSSCNHSIISYGTFGVVTSLFADGTTIVYDLGVPIDNRGQTVGMGIAAMLPNKWLIGNETHIGVEALN